MSTSEPTLARSRFTPPITPTGKLPSPITPYGSVREISARVLSQRPSRIDARNAFNRGVVVTGFPPSPTSSLGVETLGVSPLQLLSTVVDRKGDHVETTCVVENSGDQKPFTMVILHTLWTLELKLVNNHFLVHRTRGKQDLYLHFPRGFDCKKFFEVELGLKSNEYEQAEDAFRISPEPELIEALGLRNLLGDQFKISSIEQLKLAPSIEGQTLVLISESQLFQARFNLPKECLELSLPPMDPEFYKPLIDYFQNFKACTVFRKENVLKIQFPDQSTARTLLHLFKYHCKETDQEVIEKYLNSPKTPLLNQIALSIIQGQHPGPFPWIQCVYKSNGVIRGDLPLLTLTAPQGNHVTSIKMEMLVRSNSGRHHYSLMVGLPRMIDGFYTISTKEGIDPTIDLDASGHLYVRTQNLETLVKIASYFVNDPISLNLVKQFYQIASNQA